MGLIVFQKAFIGLLLRLPLLVTEILLLKTVIGQTIASIIMILGYGIIAVPTGLVTAELVKGDNKNSNTKNCPSCSQEGHDSDADYCKFCGSRL